MLYMQCLSNLSAICKRMKFLKLQLGCVNAAANSAFTNELTEWCKREASFMSDKVYQECTHLSVMHIVPPRGLFILYLKVICMT